MKSYVDIDQYDESLVTPDPFYGLGPATWRIYLRKIQKEMR